MLSDQGKTLFVICPIGAENSPERKASDELLEYVVEPVASPTYRIERADRIMRSGSITSQIFDLLVNAEVVVADMTSRNANVFYELAVRHAVGKPVIHMMTNGENIPFDVADQRAIYYTLDLGGAKAARSSLSKMISEIEESTEEPPSPIALAIQRDLLSKSTKAVDRRDSEILSMLSDIRSFVRSLDPPRQFQPFLASGYAKSRIDVMVESLIDFVEITHEANPVATTRRSALDLLRRLRSLLLEAQRFQFTISGPYIRSFDDKTLEMVDTAISRFDLS